MFKKMLFVLALVWAVGWVITGVVFAVVAYRQIAHPIYLGLPLVIAGILGLVPASLIGLLLRSRTWPRRFLILIVYTLVITAAVGGPITWRDYYETPRNSGPYLVWSGDPQTSMTVCWTAESNIPGRVEYMPDGATQWIASEGPVTHYPKVTLNGLQPGTKYRYRVPALGADEHVFQTAPATRQDFSFAVYGDNRHAGGLSFHRQVLRAIEREEPAHAGGFRFLLNSGDIVEKAGEGHGWQWHSFLSDITPLAASRPYEVSLGNHEAGGSGSDDRYEAFFEYGTREHWHVLDYAGVRFIALSTQDKLDAGSPQYMWLEKALGERPADTRFTVVTLHKPLLTYDPRNNYNEPERRAQLEPLFASKGVDIVFAGHVHAYEHHHLPSFEHVITGGGGVLLWAKPVPGPETVKTETCWHFCAVDVQGSKMSVRAIRVDGSVIDAFDVTSHNVSKLER